MHIHPFLQSFNLSIIQFPPEGIVNAEKYAPKDHTKKGQTAIILLIVSIASLVAIVVLSLRMAPYFMGVVIGCFGLALMFVMTEQSKWGLWHKAMEQENRY
jgi:hypothetical protein